MKKYTLFHIKEPFEDLKMKKDFSHEKKLLKEYMKQDEEGKSYGLDFFQN